MRWTWLRILAPLLLCIGAFGAFEARAATYTFRSDSFAWETAATAVSWDRSCTGYPGDDDQAMLAFTGGFKFTFGGTAYSSVRVLANGALQFGAETGFFRNYTNTTLPAGNATAQSGCVAGPTTNVMLGYWTDLNPSQAGGGNVTWQQKGAAPNRYVVVSWNSVYQYNTSTPYALQIILFENGEFKYQYGNANTTGSAATIGVQLNTGDYTLYSYNSGYNANGSAIRWFIASGEPARVAEYRMDEYGWSGNAGEVSDSSGNAHNGVRVGSAAPVANGRVCRMLDVPANTDTSISAVDTALPVSTGIGSSGTLSFWVRSNVAWTSTTPAMLMSATTDATRPFYLMRNAGGALRLAVSDSAGTTLVATTAAQTTAAATWMHVAAVWRYASGAGQSVLRIYVNGTLATTAVGTSNGNLDPSHATLFVGDNRAAATPSGATANSANGQIDELRVYNFELSAAEIALDIAQTHSCTVPPAKLEIRHASGSGLTCTPSALTVAACQDAACTVAYTAGVTGTLTASGSGITVNWPSGASFSIPAGSSTATVPVQVATAGSVVFGSSGVSPSPTLVTACNFGSPACTFTAADSGLLFDVPHHRSETSQSFTVTAVRKADNAAVCVPAFANVSRSVNFTCSYQDPASGTRPVRVGSQALNSGNNAAAACDGSGQAVSLAFNASGVATATLAYADAGQVRIDARYNGTSSGEVGLVMNGNDAFIAAPSSFGFSAITAAPIRAGTAFAATVSALNAAGAVTPNFGRETAPATATLSFARREPTGSGARDGAFSGSLPVFSGGAATATSLKWSEVGKGDLAATLAGGGYLGSGLAVSGSTGSAGAVGRFIPNHFVVDATPFCGPFTYAGQPLSLRVTAMNGDSPAVRTDNYDGSAATSPNQAKALTLADDPVLGVGAWSGSAVAASAFMAGVATVTSAGYAFSAKLTAAQDLYVRATDTDAVTGKAVSRVSLRSGRLRLSNAFGSEKSPLAVPVQAQYWSGKTWVAHTDDACTAVPAAAVVRAAYLDGRGAATSGWTVTPSAFTLAGGNANLMLSAPTGGATGSVDLALNLGPVAGGTDQSCLASHPTGTGAGLPWLRSQNGSCAATWDRDPSARASFGIYSPETRKTVHVRELF
jgi:MSHA biogenesis protein MshQ